ncbi:NAD(P)H-binding protein [Neobacillus terrae]|uniref:NAD(P)H-binding protein n=1 Tax=Neobacillus terrae TaxID=3034837 RepID=UPI00140B8B50|nr:NAD(P)H-binding protein [Neobacillus terrae]NHM29586.1 NAD(P)H-binding protein [Neobacillus terrae]
MGRTALILGATGLVGGYLLDDILENNKYERVRIISRSEVLKKHPKLDTYILDLSQMEDVREVFNVSDVFCCLGTTMKNAGSKEAFKKVDLDFPILAAKLAAEEEAEQFLIVSAMGASRNSSFFYNRVKGEMEERVKSFPFNGVYIFRPSLLLGNRKEFRLGEKTAEVLSIRLPFLFRGNLKKYAPVKAEQVAKFMAEKAIKGEKGIFIYESDEMNRLQKQEQS